LQIFHHLGIKISQEEKRELVRLGIKLKVEQPMRSGIMVGFEISEDDPRWKKISWLVADPTVTDLVYTKFSQLELREAQILEMMATSHTGYPQPLENFGFLSATYDLSNYCHTCGIGAHQVRPFRIKSVPSLKRRIMQLNWVYDEFFVAHEVWQTVFRPFDIDSWPVILHGTGEEIDSLVQIRIHHQATVEPEGASNCSCSVCGRSKAVRSLRGFAPAPMSSPASIFKSKEYYGSGSLAVNLVYVCSSLYSEIKKSNLRGVQFYPCQVPRP
jgi:hypothetical protein